MDDWFDIDVEPDGTFRSHDYADRVPNCWNTWNRLSQDYYDLGQDSDLELPDFPEGKASLPGVSGVKRRCVPPTCGSATGSIPKSTASLWRI